MVIVCSQHLTKDHVFYYKYCKGKKPEDDTKTINVLILFHELAAALAAE